MALSSDPESAPFLVMPLCSVIGYELLPIERRKRFTRLWYKPSPASPLLLTGWLPDMALKRARTTACPCQCRQVTTGLPTPGPPTPVVLRRDLPLYAAPKESETPVGLLARGHRVEPPETMPRHPGWARVTVSGQGFYLPYRAAYFTRKP